MGFDVKNITMGFNNSAMVDNDAIVSMHLSTISDGLGALGADAVKAEAALSVTPSAHNTAELMT